MYDVVIIGGGPAGATLGCYLGMAGVNCLILEKEKFPRPHVGESLVPSTTKVFRELDFLPVMEEAGFPHKYGAAWTSDASNDYDMNWDALDEESIVRFESRKQEGVNQSYTYHVDRAKFDDLLLKQAVKKGAEVIQQALVKKVTINDKGAQITYKQEDSEQTVNAKMVVDASGRDTFLGSRQGLKIKDPNFDQIAIHTWYKNYDRPSGDRKDYIFIHFVNAAQTWIWQIPITHDVTSVGLVTQKRTFVDMGLSREEFFHAMMENRQDVYDNIQKAEQIKPLKTEGDYSYAMSEMSGDRFVLIGDAARFVDPIFSSGVSVALTSARFASHDIINAIKSNDFRKQSFARFEETMRRGCQNWYEFIKLYYRLNVLFTYYVRHPKYKIDVLQFLQGDVFDKDDHDLLKEMRSMVKKVEENENHVWHKLLNDLSSETLRKATVS